jgi:hypothetical protein
MGWTGTHYDKRNGGLRGFFEREFCLDNEFRTLKFLDFAALKRGQECYAACESVVKATGERKVFALVILCKFTRDEFNLTYKDMDESMGPCYHDCPERILNLLTPPEGTYAPAWRKTAWERVNERKAARGRLKVGDTLFFPKGLKFRDGVERRTFIVMSLKPKRFRSGDDGCHVRLSAETLKYSTHQILRGGVEVYAFKFTPLREEAG